MTKTLFLIPGPELNSEVGKLKAAWSAQAGRGTRESRG
jgi:hypothetical protein